MNIELKELIEKFLETETDEPLIPDKFYEWAVEQADFQLKLRKALEMLAEAEQ